MTATVITYNGVASSDIAGLYVTNVGRDITPGVRDVYVDVPGRAGTWHFPEEAGDRGLVLEFAIVGDTPALRRSALRQAGRWLHRQGRAKLIIDDEPDRYVLAALAGAISAEERLTLSRFSAEFRTSPYALDTTIDTATVVTSGTVTVTASADLADYMLPSIEVTAPGGGLPSGFTLTVGTRTLVYGAAISAGATVTVSSISSTVTAGADTDTDLDGLFDPADLRMTTVSGDFAYLAPGANAVTVTTGATVDLRWRRRYV